MPRVGFAFMIQLLLASYKVLDTANVQIWLPVTARYVIYFFMIEVTGELLHYLCHKVHFKRVQWSNVLEYLQILLFTGVTPKYIKSVLVFGVSVAVLVYTKQKFIEQDFPCIFIAYLISKYLEMEQHSPAISYGVGMAYSFFEGYLVHIIPNDGCRFFGFQENIRAYEGSQHVFFPVKKLFIVITKSLYCPPDLKELNKPNRDDLPYIEACTPLNDVEKDVAGVKNRTYRNSAYKIHRGPGRPQLYLSVECATPLHTLQRVLARKEFHHLSNTNTSEVVNDFCETLTSIISTSPECRGKCELVYFDDTDPNQNLADVLINKVHEIEPDFENLILKNNSLRR